MLLFWHRQLRLWKYNRFLVEFIATDGKYYDVRTSLLGPFQNSAHSCCQVHRKRLMIGLYFLVFLLKPEHMRKICRTEFYLVICANFYRFMLIYTFKQALRLLLRIARDPGMLNPFFSSISTMCMLAYVITKRGSLLEWHELNIVCHRSCEFHMGWWHERCPILPTDTCPEVRGRPVEGNPRGNPTRPRDSGHRRLTVERTARLMLPLIRF